MDLTVTVADHRLPATWTNSAPQTRAALVERLPVSGQATRWGDELYFRTDIDVPPEDATATVEVGAVAYWSQGNAICLFWGPTPASIDEQPRAASPVNVIAQVADVSPLDELQGDAKVSLAER